MHPSLAEQLAAAKERLDKRNTQQAGPSFKEANRQKNGDHKRAWNQRIRGETD